VIDRMELPEERPARSEQGELCVQCEVGLLLRAHAEEGWLSREVLPVVRQLEAPKQLPAAQVDAARAYLEVVWVEAQLRARQSDAMRAQLQHLAEATRLSDRACRYHAAVYALRGRVAARVAPILGPT
jgi:hypothetical protein